MHHNWNIERWEVEFVYTHIWVAHLIFQCIDFTYCHQVAQVAFQEEVALVVVELHPCHYDSSVTVASFQYHFGNEGSRLFDFHESLPGFSLWPPSLCYAQETPVHASSLLGLRREVSWLVAAFPVLWCTNTLLRPFCPYSGQGTCWTVLAVPDLPALPSYLTCWKPTSHLLLHLKVRFSYYLDHIRLRSLL